MRIRLDKIGDETFRWQEMVTIPAASLDRFELLELSEIVWGGQVRLEGPSFRLDARLAYEQSIACDRCLKRIKQPIDTDVRLWVIRNVPLRTEEEIELTAEDLETVFVDGEELDADRILIEQLQLNVPMRALCRDDCLGLCSQCGVNRNLESCDCQGTDLDPRWEPLRSLKETR